MVNGNKGFRNKQIAIFCGSASGNHFDYHAQAFTVGQTLAKAGHRIVYGGGNVGLMGAVADGSLQAGGQVIGVMPRALADREIAHTALTELILVENMHDRKAKMAERAEAFVVLPGGSGTLEECFEQWTWAQIGYHRKPIGLLNLNGYFDPLMIMFDQMVHAGFLSDLHRKMLFHSPHVDDLLAGFATYAHPPVKSYQRAK